MERQRQIIPLCNICNTSPRSKGKPHIGHVYPCIGSEIKLPDVASHWAPWSCPIAPLCLEVAGSGVKIQLSLLLKNTISSLIPSARSDQRCFTHISPRPRSSGGQLSACVHLLSPGVFHLGIDRIRSLILLSADGLLLAGGQITIKSHYVHIGVRTAVQPIYGNSRPFTALYDG